MSLWNRIVESKKELDAWPQARRESALKEANVSASYELRANRSAGIPTGCTVVHMDDSKASTVKTHFAAQQGKVYGDSHIDACKHLSTTTK